MASSSRIALVDDDDAVRDATARFLERDGHAVAGFESGDAFLDRFTATAYDIILLDIRMPGLSGIEVLRALAERHIRTPVIVLTGHGDIQLAVEAMKLGAVDFIEKPYSPAELLRSVRIALAERASVDAARDDRQEFQEALEGLTQRQRDVLSGIAAGKPNKVIAYELGLSTRTVEAYRARLFERLGVRSTAEAVRAAVSAGLV